MPGTVLHELSRLGQSIWLDNISREMFESGYLKGLIEKGLRGQTSNPSIFEKSVKESSVYDNSLRELAAAGKTAFEIYDELTTADIQNAADIFLNVYESTGGLDGYVSLEINPELAFSPAETVSEGKRLHARVDRPNLMLKVPATEAGFEAIEEFTSLGFNVNATLIFSLTQYEKTAEAYIRGLEKFSGNPGKIRSVASVFVSRVDTAADKILKEMAAQDKIKNSELDVLLGRAAVANAGIIYGSFSEIFSSEKFQKLKAEGANIQRPLWASTGTKDPAYSDIKYVEELIAKDTVNTTPDKTLSAFMDRGAVKEALSEDTAEAEDAMERLAGAGIDIPEICNKLLEDGVSAFVKSFRSLLDTIEEKKKRA